MTRLLLVRHAMTGENPANVFQGSTDLPLCATGTWQAERLRDRLDGEKISAIYSSLLSRSKETASIIASAHGLNVLAAAELNECDFGEAEGLTFDEISCRFPQLAEALLGDDTATCFPGGENLEDVFRRVGRFKERLAAYGNEATVCIVGHGASLQTLVCHLLELPAPYWRRFRMERGSISVIDAYEGGAVMTRLNDTCHLERAH